jgi:hypothetical protein
MIDDDEDNEPGIETARFKPPRVALGVGCDAEVLDRCQAVLGLPILRVGHASAACERMLTTRPLVVIAGTGIMSADMTALKNRALDTGAQLVLLEECKEEEALTAHLKKALRSALIARGD